MVSDSPAELLQAIRSLGLLETHQLDQLTGDAVRLNPQQLVTSLVSRGWLTLYQATLLLNGRGGDLVVGPYRLLEPIGEGGMGTVYKARHVGLKRLVALKIIHAAVRDRGRALERFQREAEAAAQLSHPNIVTLYDAGQAGETHFLAMELIDGADLARLLKAHGPFPVKQACEIVRQTAQGLQHAHSRGLVHRDVKPSNLLLVPPEGPRREGLAGYLGGTVKLLDLGVARLRLADSSDAGELTGEGVMIGTVDYLAPEQAVNARAVDHRADLYALGCTFYHLLAGRPPFPDGTQLERLYKHQYDTPPSVRQLRPDTPPAVDALVDRLLAKAPDERPASAGEVAAMLGGSGPISLSAIPPVVESPTMPLLETVDTTIRDVPSPPSPRPPERNTSIATVVVAAFLLPVLLLLAWRTWGPRSGDGPSGPSVAHPEQLMTYLPADTFAVAVLDAEALFGSAAIERLHPDLGRGLLGKARMIAEPLSLLGIDAPADLARVQLAVAGPRAALPRVLVLAEGRRSFDSTLFEIREGGIGRDWVGPASVPLYRWDDTTRRESLYLAIAGRFLVASPDRDLVVAVLRQADGPPPSAHADTERLHRFLARAAADKLAAGLAIDLRRVTLPPPDDKRFGDEIVREVVANATWMEAGLATADDLRLALAFEAPDAAAARKLEAPIDGVRGLANVALLAAGRDLQPWLRLIARSTTTIEGSSVRVTSRVPGAEE